MTETSTRPGPLRETLTYFWWFYTPFSRMSASDIYDLVFTNSYSENGLYLNLGYWKNAANIDEACQGMATLLAETGELGPEHDLLDVGFGFADQDMYWLERFGPRSITGINITKSQVELARKRVADRGMSDRIDLREGSATEMPFEANRFDRVFALESAFHFHPRERFFAEALRVLRPGGRIVLADMARMPPAGGMMQRMNQKNTWHFYSMKYDVPKENADDVHSYARKMEAAGFVNVRAESIREHVFGPLHRYMAREPKFLERWHPPARFPYKIALKFDADKVYSAYDYLLAVGEKPKA